LLSAAIAGAAATGSPFDRRRARELLDAMVVVVRAARVAWRWVGLRAGLMFIAVY
jgi:hypothetical protein